MPDLSRSNKPTSPWLSSPKLALDTRLNQFSCGMLISAVSSTEKILYDGFIRPVTAFSMVVLPPPVEPITINDFLLSSKNQMYAAMSTSNVSELMRSTTVIGSSRNFLMVKLLLMVVTSFLYSAARRWLPGRDASTMG